MILVLSIRPATSLGFWRKHLLESLGPGINYFLSLVAFVVHEGGQGQMQLLAFNSEGASHLTLLCMISKPFLCVGLLTMSGWCVEFCIEGSISLLHSLCSKNSVCSSSLLQHSQSSSKIHSVIEGAKWYATEWSRTLWLLSKTSVLSLCSPPPVSLEGNPIFSKVSHNHVDSSANSTLKAIASLTLSIVTIVSLPCLSSNLPAYLGSALVKIMLISSCCGFKFVVRLPPLHAKHSPPRPSNILCSHVVFIPPLFQATHVRTFLQKRPSNWRVNCTFTNEIEQFRCKWFFCGRNQSIQVVVDDSPVMTIGKSCTTLECCGISNIAIKQYCVFNCSHNCNTGKKMDFCK